MMICILPLKSTSFVSLRFVQRRVVFVFVVVFVQAVKSINFNYVFCCHVACANTLPVFWGYHALHFCDADLLSIFCSLFFLSVPFFSPPGTDWNDRGVVGRKEDAIVENPRRPDVVSIS